MPSVNAFKSLVCIFFYVESLLVHWTDEGTHSILRADDIVHPCPGDVAVGETVTAKFGKKEYQAMIIEKGWIVCSTGGVPGACV